MAAKHKHAFATSGDVRRTADREPRMNLEDLDTWVWSLRFRELGWPRDERNVPLHVAVPVELPDHCLLWGCTEPATGQRGYCTRHYWQWYREEKSGDRSTRYRTGVKNRRGLKICTAKKCWRKTNRYIDLCDRCYRKTARLRQEGRTVYDPSQDMRAAKPRKTKAELRLTEIAYNETRRQRRAEARRVKSEGGRG